MAMLMRMAVVMAALPPLYAEGDRYDTVPEVVDIGIENSKPLFEPGFDGRWTLNETERRRFRRGGLASYIECERIMAFAKEVARTGRQCITTHEMFGKLSPYTPREEVISVRAYQAVDFVRNNPKFREDLDVFLGVSNRIREQLMLQYNISTLYFHLTEMVCRKPRHWSSPDLCVKEGCLPFCMKGCPEDCIETFDDLSLETCTKACLDDCNQSCLASCTSLEWLSHPIHADANPHDCDMVKEEVCMRRLPNDFTAHIHLNEEFEGGEFFFLTPDGKKEYFQSSCGRLLGYSSGSENMHGVTGVTSGTRCIITSWLTEDVHKAEQLALPADHPHLAGRLSSL